MRRLVQAASIFVVFLLGAACQPDVEPPEPDEPLVPKMGATTTGGEVTDQASEKELE